MAYNGKKIVRVNIGPNQIFKEIPLFMPNYQENIYQFNAYRDLRIMIDCLQCLQQTRIMHKTALGNRYLAKNLHKTSQNKRAI